MATCSAKQKCLSPLILLTCNNNERSYGSEIPQNGDASSQDEAAHLAVCWELSRMLTRKRLACGDNQQGSRPYGLTPQRLHAEDP